MSGKVLFAIIGLTIPLLSGAASVTAQTLREDQQRSGILQIQEIIAQAGVDTGGEQLSGPGGVLPSGDLSDGSCVGASDPCRAGDANGAGLDITVNAADTVIDTPEVPCSECIAHFPREGAFNSVVLEQQGIDNQASVHQYGQFNALYGQQSGSGNFMGVNQFNSDNFADIRQYGNDHTITVTQPGYGFLDVTQE